MSSLKRKALEIKLQKRVRARREPSEEPEYLSDSPALSKNGDEEDSDDGSDLESQIGAPRSPGRETKDNESAGPSEADEESESDSDAESEFQEAASISFGALAKAQASLQDGKKPRAGKGLKSTKDDGWEDNEAKERKAGRKDHRDFNRSSKHAPTEISSKKAVSRKREVIPVTKRVHRDPRFEPINGPVDTAKLSRNYAFLNDYRDDEMKELRNTIKKTKDEGERDKLKRELMSMESRKRAQDRKDREEEVLSRHKKEEKELVQQGKKPFYLKESEKKKRVLLDTYSGMKKGQLDHVIERRRRKIDQKEKKKLPFARRQREGDS